MRRQVRRRTRREPPSPPNRRHLFGVLHLNVRCFLDCPKVVVGDNAAQQALQISGLRLLVQIDRQQRSSAQQILASAALRDASYSFRAQPRSGLVGLRQVVYRERDLDIFQLAADRAVTDQRLSLLEPGMTTQPHWRRDDVSPLDQQRWYIDSFLP